VPRQQVSITDKMCMLLPSRLLYMQHTGRGWMASDRGYPKIESEMCEIHDYLESYLPSPLKMIFS